MKIKNIQLMNFQSWSKDSPAINLDTEVTNIIEGPNETGKSVVFKVLYNMVFPGYWSSAELIRRGYVTAVMMLTLADDSIIAYTIAGSHYTVILQDSSTDTETTWQDYKVIPKEVVTKLGLIIDSNSKIILNIIDKDVPLPFIKTSSTFNASLLKAIVEPVEITEFFENLTTEQTNVDKGKQYFFNLAQQKYAAATAIQYEDENLIAGRLEDIDSLLDISKSVDMFSEQLDKCIAIQKNKPASVTDPSRVVYKLNLYDHLLAGVSYLADVIHWKQHRPPVIKNPDSTRLDLKGLDIISASISAIDNILGKCANRPKQLLAPDRLHADIKVYDDLQTAIDTLQSVQQCIREKPIHAALPNLDAEMKCYDIIQNIKSALASFGKLRAEKFKTETKQSEAYLEVIKMQEEYGVCPTCGRILEEHNV